MSTALDFETRFHGKIAVVEVRGEIDVSTMPQLRQVLDRTSEQTTQIILELSGVPFCDSAGLGVLIAVWKRLRRDGGALRLAGCHRQLRRILHVTGLDAYMPCHSSRHEALRAFENRVHTIAASRVHPPGGSVPVQASRWTLRPLTDPPSAP